MVKGSAVTLTDLADATLRQRFDRMVDGGPALRGLGSARFQLHGSTLYVGGVRVRSGRERELIERVVQFARERWLNISWIVTDDRESPGLPGALGMVGFTHRETLRLMGCIGMVQFLPPHRSDLVIAPITSRAQMEQYERISQWGFNDNPYPDAHQVRMRGQERWDEESTQLYHYFMAWINGDPVSGAYVSLWEQVPTIYGVVTIPPARRTGAAALVMHQLVRSTLDRGFPWTCLYVAVGNPAQRLYESLGYTPLLEQSTYIWREVFR